MPSAEADASNPSPAGFNLIRLAWLLPIAAIGVAIRKPTEDNSYLWHIEAGVRQLAEGSVLTADPFTFTARGTAWRTQSWLLELAYGWLERLGTLTSADLVVGVSAVVLLASVALRISRGRGLLGPLGVLWVMWLTLGFFTARPVFPSLAMLALVMLVTDRAKLRWAIPLMFWVWGSIHGGFIVGLGYLVLLGLRDRVKERWVDVGAATVAVSLTAHGWGVWGILASFAGSSGNLNLISEWLPPDMVSLPWLPFLLAVLGLVALGAAGKVEPRSLWVILPFLGFAFTANRAVPITAIALAPYVFVRSGSELGVRPFPRAIGLIAAVTILLIGVVAPVDDSLFRQSFPVSAAKYLDDTPVFHDDGVGGYLIYAGYPDVFIDDRAELFGDLYVRFTEAVQARPGWEDLFAEYGIKQALLRTSDALVPALAASDWSVVYRDAEFVVLRAG